MTALFMARHLLALLASPQPPDGGGRCGKTPAATVRASDEIFAPVPGHPGYLVGDAGTVLSVKRGGVRPLRGQIKSNGYVSVNFSTPNPRSVQTKTVHPLVAEAFLGPRAPGMVVCHADGTRTNNRVENLRWGTVADNYADAVKHGAISARPLVEECYRGHPYDEANTYTDPRGRRICRACKRIRELTGGSRG